MKGQDRVAFQYALGLSSLERQASRNTSKTRYTLKNEISVNLGNKFPPPLVSQGPLNRGGFQTGGGFPIWTCPSFFVLFCPFLSFLGLSRFSGIFPICSGMVRGFSRFVLFLFLSLLRAPTRNSPERVRDTIWTFPEKSGKHPGLETPRFSFSQIF